MANSKSPDQTLRLPRQRRRPWWPFAVIGVLVVAGLILPPVSLIDRVQNYGYSSLTADKPAESHPDGMVLSIDPAEANGTWLVQLGSIPRQDFMDGKAGENWAQAKASLPATAVLKSPVYTISARGEAPKHVYLNLAIPNEAEPYNRLDVLAWDGKAWQWAPSEIDRKTLTALTDLSFAPQAVAMVQSTAAGPLQVSADLLPGQTLPANAAYLNEIVLDGLALGPDGTVAGQPAAAPSTNATLLMGVRNYTDVNAPDTDDLFTLLGDPQLRISHVAAIMNQVDAGKFAGVALDYRGVDPAQREGFTALVELLAGGLHDRGLRLAVVVTPPTELNGRWQDGGYDWRSIGAVADVVQIALPADPMAYAADGTVSRMLDWAVHEVDRGKLQAGVPTLSIDQVGDRDRTVTIEDAVKALGQVVLPNNTDGTPIQIGTEVLVSLVSKATVPVFDQAAGTYKFTYQDDTNTTHTVWVGSPALLASRVRPLGALGLRGANAGDLFATNIDTGLIDAFGQLPTLDANASALPAGALSLLWTVHDAAGAVLMEATASFDSPDLKVIAPATPGEYTIDGQVDGPAKAALGSVKIEVAAGPTMTPTDTLTPTPTPTYTPTPTRTPCPEPFCTPTPTRTPTNTPAPTNTPGPTNTAKPPAPPPPSGGSFRSGVQVNTNGNYWGTMPLAAQLGVSYIKAQVRWAWMDGGGGVDWGSLDGVVNAAGASGLQVLASVLEAPDFNRVCGDAGCAPADRQAAANFCGALAGRYCGSVFAIEVWNEQNLDREWGPTPDPGAYTDLLKRAYGAIKGACPSTVVISGALAPTGVHAPGGCCWDDFIYFQEMVNQGALNYMDCIGAHANANIIPPSQGSEFDPRGNHHSWTLKDTTTGYYNIGGGSRKICLTEMGFPTGEGHGGVPAGFEWAAENSLQEQTDWFVEAFTTVRGWGIFRMMTIWNLDFYPSCGGCVDQNSPYSILDGGYGAFPAYSALQGIPK